MSLPSQVELQSGGDRRLLAGLWLVWLAALSAVLVHAQRMPGVLLIAGAVLLLLSIPRADSPSLQTRHLQLQSNGSVSYGDLYGQWHRNTWRSPWYTVIRIQTSHSHWWAWISARNNSPESYRRLGIWCRYSPQQSGKLS
ncbi:MAG TPA: protein YgfX [Xanthomonadales bacterium]|nr:protein YgfX [Xanthomonadales bacterium]